MGTLLNRFAVPRATSGKVSFIKNSIYIDQLNLDDTKNSIWYIEITDVHGFNDECLDISIPPHILTQLQEGKILLIICNAWEGFNSIIEPLYKTLIITRKIPESNIHLYTGCKDITSTINYISNFFKKNAIKAFWTRIAEFEFASKEFIDPTKIEHVPSEKKFINLNRRWRPHRPTFVGLLHAKNLLRYGYVSLLENVENNTANSWENMYDYILHLNQKNKTVCSLLKENKQEIIQLKNLTVDTNNLNFSAQYLSSDLIKFYSETFFSVVTEINFYRESPLENGLTLTEKIFKPIIYRHPFLVLSVPKTLEALRSIGYKTFHPYIDEKYDLEYDDATRMLMVLREVERLCSFSLAEQVYFAEEVKNICIHNYNLLCSRNYRNTVTLALN